MPRKDVKSRYPQLKLVPARSKPDFSKARNAAAVVIQKAFKKKKSYGQAGPEIKFLDTVVTVTGALSGPTAAGSTASINLMAQGLTNITRVGNKIDIKSVEYQGCARILDTYAQEPFGASWRWALVLDKEPEAGAIATYGQIYTSPIPATCQQLGFRVINNSDRFVVLREGIIDLQPKQMVTAAMTVGSGDTYRTVKAYAKCDINTKFAGATATQADMSTNQLLFIAACTTDDGDVQLAGACRIRYTDE